MTQIKQLLNGVKHSFYSVLIKEAVILGTLGFKPKINFKGMFLIMSSTKYFLHAFFLRIKFAFVQKGQFAKKEIWATCGR